MIRNFDHVTVAVRDLDAAERFFALLGFRKEKAVVISGETFARYMGVAGIEADHVTLVHESVQPRLEVQVLHYRHPAPPADARVPALEGLGYNHVCFAVDDVDAAVRRLVAAGVRLRSEVMDFHDRKLVFLEGPEGIAVELAQWRAPAR
jgi:catechol 2,3-dioxygenase-like lactoylglutathione lyase family enzyme